MTPDRPAPGDTITLVGTNLGEASDTVGVTFTPSLTATPLSRDASQIRVVVPQGAKTGEVFVTVTKKMPDGTSITRTSNALKVMVIWKFFDPAPLFPSWAQYESDRILPGTADDIGVSVSSWTPFFDFLHLLWRVRHDGSARVFPSVVPRIDPGRVAQNPVTGEVVGVVYSQGCDGYQQLWNLTTGQVLYCNSSPQVRRYPWNVAFDPGGNLLVFGIFEIGSTGRLAVWRFAPGQPLVLDPGAPTCLTPGGFAPPEWGWGVRAQAQMSVGGDGAAWIMPWRDSNPPWSIPVYVFRVPASGGSYETRILPELSSDQGGTNWSLAADCRGEGYAIGEVANVWPSSPRPVVYRLKDMAAIATLQGLQAITGFTTDGYGDFYVSGWDPATRRSGIWRITPDQLPPDFYCPLNSPAPATPTTHATAAATCATCSPTKPGHLRLKIPARNIDEADKPAAEKLLLGAKIEPHAVWVEGTDEKPANVRWELCEVNPTWEQEHQDAAAQGIEPDAATSGNAVLFRESVLLLFDEDQPQAAVPTRPLWAIHTGKLHLKVTLDAGSAPDKKPHTIDLPIEVTYEGEKLGAASNQYDPLILKWANAYGFPPQHIKGLIQRESSFNSEQYRYEPLGWDYGATLGRSGGVLFNLRSDPYQVDYLFAEPPGVPLSTSPAVPQGAALNQLDIDGRLHATFPYYLTTGVKAPCSLVGSGVGAISTWQLLLGSNRYWPCGKVEWGWEPSWDMYKWDSRRTDNVQGTASDGTWFFFNHPAATAQTFVAASYGLMQVGYASALPGMKWFASQPERRHYLNLIPPNANTHLGSRWLAWPEPYVSSTERQAAHFKGRFDLLISRLLCTYNGSSYDPKTKGPVDRCKYSDAVIGNAASFVPSF